mmetsp:Transcript_27734/g.63883  ORF Transcript_27734/g.63883 Transcript_27734/m.63883 type:complete len:517 (+) Transcript_27734:94-1644(+)
MASLFFEVLKERTAEELEREYRIVQSELDATEHRLKYFNKKPSERAAYYKSEMSRPSSEITGELMDLRNCVRWSRSSNETQFRRKWIEENTPYLIEDLDACDSCVRPAAPPPQQNSSAFSQRHVHESTRDGRMQNNRTEQLKKIRRSMFMRMLDRSMEVQRLTNFDWRTLHAEEKRLLQLRKRSSTNRTTSSKLTKQSVAERISKGEERASPENRTYSITERPVTAPRLYVPSRPNMTVRERVQERMTKAGVFFVPRNAFSKPVRQAPSPSPSANSGVPSHSRNSISRSPKHTWQVTSMGDKDKEKSDCASDKGDHSPSGGRDTADIVSSVLVSNTTPLAHQAGEFFTPASDMLVSSPKYSNTPLVSPVPPLLVNPRSATSTGSTNSNREPSAPSSGRRPASAPSRPSNPSRSTHAGSSTLKPTPPGASASTHGSNPGISGGSVQHMAPPVESVGLRSLALIREGHDEGGTVFHSRGRSEQHTRRAQSARAGHGSRKTVTVRSGPKEYPLSANEQR